MRSRAELRRAAEWVLRAALVAGLAVALWRSLRPHERGPVARASDVAGLGRVLSELTRSPSAPALDLDVQAVPSRAQRDWLVALRRAGVAVRWHGAPAPLAVEAQRVREPDGRLRLLVAADSGHSVAFADSAGALDTLRAARGGASLEAQGIVSPVVARDGAVAAHVGIPAPEPQRAVLVLGRASWESKFVMSALEEAGWTVRGRMPAAPGVAVSSTGLLPNDTARYDAVVALDSTAADLAPAIARFVGQGGGLVVAGAATELAPLQRLAPARAGARRPGRILLAGDTLTRADLPVRPLAELRADALRLEREASGVTVAVRRAGLGRVLAVGYDESWRWRMLGGANGPAQHRAWWSRAVGLVAPERAGGGAPQKSNELSSDAAPVAALVDALGAPTAPPPARHSRAREPLPLILLALLAAALLAETASRRFRGAR
jgi:hypothetical protein